MGDDMTQHEFNQIIIAMRKFEAFKRKQEEYRQAQLLENCVVRTPPRTMKQYKRELRVTEEVEDFLAKCQSDWM